MTSLRRLLKIHPGEGRLATRLLALMVTAWAGFAIGANGVEGLLFTRVGPKALPYLYIGLGVTTAVIMLGVNRVFARPQSQRLLLVAFPIAAVMVLAMRALLLLRQEWVYPANWLTMMVLWTGTNVVTWGVAGAVHDTRQARRLFSLYATGVILGSAAGGLATAPLAGWLGAENLLVIWAGALAAGFFVALSALRAGPASTLRRSRRVPRPRTPLTAGVRTVRASPLLASMSVCIALLAMLYFSLALLFAQGATARFPDADQLAGFLGLFTGMASAVALLASVLAANWLGARFGITSMILAFTLIYVGGFAVVVGTSTFVALAVFRFVQLAWMNGVWVGAWQSLYNVVPADQRETTRVFVDGVMFQGGVVAAGVVLILADRAQQPGAVALLALLVAGIATVSALRLRGAYAGAVMAALRAGNPDVFRSEEQPFVRLPCDPGALAVARQAATDRDPAVRRMAVEILGTVEEASARPALEHAITDEDPTVRATALRGLAGAGAEAADEEKLQQIIHDRLRDDDVEVRLAALNALINDHATDEQALRPLLADSDPRVRARAAGQLLSTAAAQPARATLSAMAGSDESAWRAEAVMAWAAAGGTAAAATAMTDPDPLVRRAAASALAGSEADAAIEALTLALADSDAVTQAEVVEALVTTGAAAIPALSEAVDRRESEAGAIRVLVRLNALNRDVLDDYVRRQIAVAEQYAALQAALGDGADSRVELVSHSLRHAARRHATDALLAATASWDTAAIAAVQLALENLDARDSAQRANALEVLDAYGKPDVVRRLMAVWEGPTANRNDRREVLAELMHGPDSWLRAAAAFAASAEPSLRVSVSRLADSDPTSIVRTAAAEALRPGGQMEALASLSLMERMVFLRRVSLFQDLSPGDLEQVAKIATEHSFSGGAFIAEQGEPGEELHVVVNGEITVLVDRDRTPPVEVARRRAGECVGEMAVINRAPRMASLVARGPVKTLAIERRRFERIVLDRPEASLAVMGVLCDRIRQLHGVEPPEMTF